MKIEPLIYVTNLKKSIDFYCKVLPFPLGELFPNNENPTYAPVFYGVYKLMLCLTRESNEKLHPSGLGGSGFQLFVNTENVDKVYNRIEEKCTIVDPIETKKWGDREFTIKDPDGYLISFWTTTKEEKI